LQLDNREIIGARLIAFDDLHDVPLTASVRAYIDGRLSPADRHVVDRRPAAVPPEPRVQGLRGRDMPPRRPPGVEARVLWRQECTAADPEMGGSPTLNVNRHSKTTLRKGQDCQSRSTSRAYEPNGTPSLRHGSDR
jgi:hypothetical protein